jgi:hypothetical protein
LPRRNRVLQKLIETGERHGWVWRMDAGRIPVC